MCVPSGTMTVRLPMGVKPVKVTKDLLPKIPILVSRKAVPGDTMLLALEDPIITQARAVEKEALAAAQPPPKKQMVIKSSP